MTVLNSDYLTLLNTGSVSNAAVIFGNGSQSSSSVSESSGLDFAALLANKIKDKEEELDAGKKSREAYAIAANALSATSLISPAAEFLNPIKSVQQAPKVEKLEKPVKETQSSKASNQTSKETEKATKNDDAEKTEKTSETENAKESEKTEEVKEEVSLNAEDTDKLKELLDTLSEEDKEALLADPENFAENLAKIVEEMPDSELKEKITEVLSSKDKVNEMQVMLAAQQQQKTVQVANVGKEAEMSFENKDEKEDEKEDETLVVHTKHKAESTAKAEETEASQSDDKKVKAESKTETKSSLPEESLRDEFARIHKLNEETVQETAEVSAQPDAVPEVITEDMTSVEHMAPELKAAAEQLIEKFFASSANVKENQVQSREFGKSETYDINGHIRAKGVNQANSSNNSSMNNGFSFQSGHSESGIHHAPKAAHSAPVAHTSFADMLQKAELVKTKDGAKVLNIEVSQEELGKLEMELKSKDGTVTAKLTAANEDVKNKIEEAAPRIIEQLMSQGVNIAQLNVDVSSKQPDKSGEFGFSGIKKSNGNSDSVDFADRLSEAENELSSLDVLTNLRRAALNIQYIDEIV